MCKQRYTQVDAFYHQLCPPCAVKHHERRDARTDLTGRRALLTGGRAKIGMYIALRLLRDGAHTTITTRFPRDAARRFGLMEDSGDWLHRLRIVGIDLRDPGQVVALADSVAEQGPLDILINNAAQTVRRSPGSYAHLIDGERAAAAAGRAPEVITFGDARGAHPALLSARARRAPRARAADARRAGARRALRGPRARRHTASRSTPAASSPTSRTSTAGRRTSTTSTRSSCSRSSSATRPRRSSSSAACAARWPPSPARRTYVVNVSAMEGSFGRGYKGPGHPHTNMAKAALNMLTRTSAKEMLGDGILMTSVDTGWITDERPHHTKLRLADEGFHAPLDLVDGAARVYDPIVRGEAGEDLHGVFLKDYEPTVW